MIERVIPTRPYDRARRCAQHRLKSHIQVIAVMSIIAIDAPCTGTNGHVCPFRPIIAYKDAVIGIPRLIVVDKRNGALRDTLAPIIRPVQERRGHIIVFLDGFCLTGGRRSRPYVTVFCRGKGDDGSPQNARYDDEQDDEMREEAPFMFAW